MRDFLYHGSITPGISKLQARSILHGTDQEVVYLTNSIPYALFYIWDSQHNGYSGKHVTGGFRDGTAFYEEQFPDQLRAFYQGVSGYLYHIPFTENVQPMPNRDGLFFQPSGAVVTRAEFIPDVYAELLKYESAGQLQVLRYNEQSAERKAELTDMIATAILRCNFYEDDEGHQQFMKRYFTSAWRKANEQKA